MLENNASTTYILNSNIPPIGKRNIVRASQLVKVKFTCRDFIKEDSAVSNSKDVIFKSTRDSSKYSDCSGRTEGVFELLFVSQDQQYQS